MPHLYKHLLLLPFCNICFASELLTQNQITSIKRQIGDAFYVFENASVGALHNGMIYATISYETKREHERNEIERENSQEYISRCSIFQLQPLTLLVKSKPFISYGQRDSVGCDIENGLLVIEHFNSGSLISHSTETWKFKLVGNRFVLIGYDDATSESGDIDNDRPYVETQKSLNFLTNKALLWRKAGYDIEDYSLGVRWHKPFLIKKAKKIKEISVPFVSPLWDFSSFDVDTFRNWIDKNNNLCGYINENYKYQSCKK